MDLIWEIANPGASGAIFYLTKDDEFILKTVSMKEAEFLQEFMGAYNMNFQQNKMTMLPKFFGVGNETLARGWMFVFHKYETNIDTIVAWETEMVEAYEQRQMRNKMTTGAAPSLLFLQLPWGLLHLGKNKLWE